MISEARGVATENKFIDALRLIIKLMGEIKRYEDKLLEEDPDTENPNEDLYILGYEAMGECLEKIGTQQAYLTAKTLYEKMSYIEPGCQCWEKIIKL